MIKQLIKKFIPLCLIMFLLSGCWDELNIEERGFIFGSAIDIEEGSDKDNPKIALTNQFIVPSGIGSPESGGSESSKAYNNLTVEGDRMEMINRNMSTRGSRLPFYGHLKLLILSEDLAKKANLISRLSDFFLRGIHMRREIKVFISNGEAKDLLNTDPTPESTPAQYINLQMEHHNKTAETIETLNIGTMQSYLLGDTSYVIPKLKVIDGEPATDGGAILNGPDNKLVGSLNERETKGYNLATKKNDGGSISIQVNGNKMVFDIDETKRNMKINVDDPKHVDVSINVDAEGYLEEMFGSENVLKDDYLDKIADKVASKMKKLIKETIKKSQKDLHVDILNVGKTMKEKHYNIWKKVRDDWEKGEEYFGNTTFHVTVDAKVLDTGAINRTKN